MADKITKLSDAIRLGSTFRPQCRGVLFSKDGRSCVLGAAYEALTGKTNVTYSTTVVMYLHSRFPEIGLKTISDLIFDNDGNGLGGICKTREQIADDLAKKGY